MIIISLLDNFTGSYISGGYDGIYLNFCLVNLEFLLFLLRRVCPQSLVISLELKLFMEEEKEIKE